MEAVEVANTHFETVGAFAAATGLDEGVVVRSLERLAQRGLLQRVPPPLSAAETAFLDAHSGVAPDADALFDARLGSSIAEMDDQGKALTADEVALLLGISASRVRHRLNEGRLYALPSSGRGAARRFPSWQFINGEAIAHIGRVVEVLPAWFHPMEVEGFFANAVVDELADGHAVVVRDWLAHGGAVEPVVELAKSLSYGL